MPYEQQDIPPETKCLRKVCNHLYITHDEGDGCDLCSCPNFDLPYALRPVWVADPDRDMFRWICLKCFWTVFGRRRQPGMTTVDPKECVKCHTIAICCTINIKKNPEVVNAG